MRLLQTLLILCLLGWPATVASASSPEQGRKLYVENCATCHGQDARGDGTDSADLDPPPADLTKIASRRERIWPMLEVMSIIDGYTKNTTPRDGMPIIKEISEGPMIEFDTGNGLVSRVPARLVALVNYLETIQKPRPVSYVP